MIHRIRRGAYVVTYDPAARGMGGVMMKAHRGPAEVGTVADARDLQEALAELLRQVDGRRPGGGWV